MIPERHIVPLTIFFTIIGFQIYYVFSDQRHQKFFEFVGIALVFIAMVAAYLLYSGLNLKTRYVKKLIIDPSEESWTSQKNFKQPTFQKTQSRLNLRFTKTSQIMQIKHSHIKNTQTSTLQAQPESFSPVLKNVSLQEKNPEMTENTSNSK